MQGFTTSHRLIQITAQRRFAIPALRSEFQAAVDDANNAVSRAEAIKKVAILEEDFTEACGQLTPTAKVRRQVIMEQFAAQIDALHGEGAS